VKYITTSEFFRGRRRFPSMEKAQWETLEYDTLVDGIPFAAGSRFKRFETLNFGYVVFDREARTPEGWIPGRRVFRW